MAKAALTGTRIRDRRMVAGIRQADLARTAGISPAYLNLIEHNSRRPTPEVLSRIAAGLGVAARSLEEGAGSSLFEALREAAAFETSGPHKDGRSGRAHDPQALADRAPPPPPEVDRIEEFATRFPGWAALVVARQERLAILSRNFAAQAERLTHDPHLSAALIEIVSAITSVRSTAAILAETEDIDPSWRARFHHNLAEDSERLTDAAAALAAYLDSGRAIGEALTTPQEEVEAWMAAQDYRIESLEGAFPLSAHEVIDLADDTSFATDQGDTESRGIDPLSRNADRTGLGPGLLATNAARSLASAYAEQYRRDALVLPRDVLIAEVAAMSAMAAQPPSRDAGVSRRRGAAKENPGIDQPLAAGGLRPRSFWDRLPDPAVLAGRFGVSLSVVLRRMAVLPPGQGWGGAGLIRCDGAGAIVFRRPLEGFAMPRFGAGCPLWPLYDALRRPGTPVRAMLETAGLVPRRFAAFAVAEQQVPGGFDAPEVIEAVMLIVPVEGPASAYFARDADGQSDFRSVGPTCRICTRAMCPARREPSILSELA